MGLSCFGGKYDHERAKWKFGIDTDRDRVHLFSSAEVKADGGRSVENVQYFRLIEE